MDNFDSADYLSASDRVLVAMKQSDYDLNDISICCMNSIEEIEERYHLLVDQPVLPLSPQPDEVETEDATPPQSAATKNDNQESVSLKEMVSSFVLDLMEIMTSTSKELEAEEEETEKIWSEILKPHIVLVHRCLESMKARGLVEE